MLPKHKIIFVVCLLKPIEKCLFNFIFFKSNIYNTIDKAVPHAHIWKSLKQRKATTTRIYLSWCDTKVEKITSLFVLLTKYL